MGYKQDFEIAKNASIYDYCKTYEPHLWISEGNFLRHRDMSSLIVSKYTTVGKSLFFDNSNRTGTPYGDLIDYVRIFVYPGLDFKGAVTMIAQTMSGIIPNDYEDDIQDDYILPDRSSDTRAMVDYLCGRRKIDKRLIDIAVDNNILYQTEGEYRNAIFTSDRYDWSEVRGIGQKKYCRTLKGSAKNGYWSFTFDGDNDFDKTAVICEGAIDAMSFAMIVNKYEGSEKADKYAYVSIGGAAKLTAVQQCIEDYDNVILSPDNDKAGDAMIDRVKALYNYDNIRVFRPTGFKDWNSMLISNVA